MINLPKTTEFNRRVPKQKFYENLNVSSSLKKVFVEQVKAIFWSNKIATSTTNLAKGESVTEIEVFVIELNNSLLDENLLRQIDREIPYHILFLLEFDGKYQACIGYKEKAESGSNAFKVDTYYRTEFLEESSLPLKLEGLSLDDVYENFVRQIAGSSLQRKDCVESLKESVLKENQRKKLLKQIDALQNKIRKEKQLNRQMEMSNCLRALKQELETL